MRISGPQSLIIKDINGNFTIKEPYNNPIQYKIGVNPNNGVNFNLNYNHIN